MKIGAIFVISYGKALLTSELKWIRHPSEFMDIVNLNASFGSFDEAMQCFVDYDMLFSIERNQRMSHDSKYMDYNVGLLTLIICKPEDGDFTDSYVVAIFTIDDDSWMGFSQDGKFDLDDLAKNFTETFGTKLPTESYLNEFLSNYKIYGHNAG